MTVSGATSSAAISAISVLITKKSLDVMKAQGEMALKLLNNASQIQSVSNGLSNEQNAGSKINIYI
ncbi:hypothetical protein MCHI_000789 [Candidatus Magnetoovum chiemensis]|nr:hypothetical protein MCHI_000789 [Candidatus Magnetoovum chiemensis]